MQITFHGGRTFLLKTGKSTLALDPSDNFPQKVDGATFSSGEISAGTKADKTFEWPGEYELQGVTLTALPTFQGPKSEESPAAKKNNLVFLLGIENLKVCHLGHLGHKFSPEQVEMLGTVDLLFAPIGADAELSSERLKEIVNQIDPRIIIPMGKIDAEATRLLGKMLGLEPKIMTEEKWEIERENLPKDKAEVVVLKKV